MDILIASLDHTLRLVFRMGVIMFISLFGVEILVQLGVMKYLKPMGKPVARLANLPSESALSFLSAIGSMIAAHTMTAQFHQDGRLNNREMVATGVLNTVPFHFKETLTFQLPIVLPLLGMKLCMIYIAAFWLAGVIKICFVIVYGRLLVPRRREASDAFDALECNPADQDCSPRPFARLLRDAWEKRKKMFLRMILLLFFVTLAVQLLMNSGAMVAFERLIIPMTSLLKLPAAVIGPITAYILSPTVGITYMSNLLEERLVTESHAIIALFAGSLLMIPATRLRRTLPRYTAIFGLKSGLHIGGLTTVLSMSSRAVMLVWVLVFFR
ncbi:MAG: hypothetical protein HKM93_06415 [Desulfobacteraceae bacterium]|nr:hypothetical protein [Desulfobacteraceae bacterium]